MNINRRDFIGLSSAGLMSLAVGTGCSGIRRGDLSPAANDGAIMKKLGKDRYDILYHASLAPSPHNTQPWLITIRDIDNWVLGADPARRMASTDPLNHRCVLSLGCFIENLSLAAEARGFSIKLRLLTGDFFGEEIAAIQLVKAPVKPYPLDRIASRSTVKKGLLNKPLSAEHVEKLSGIFNGRFHYFPRGDWHARCIGEGAVRAFQSWLDDETAQKEHVQWLRIANREAAAKRDGLTTEGMGIKGVMGLFVRSFLSNEDFSGSFMKKETMKHVRPMINEGAGYVIITGFGETVAGMLETGRRFERMALLARELNIGIQPLTQMLEMKPGRAEIRENHPSRIDPQLILRVGYVDGYPVPVTLRRPLSAFVSFA
ncbi:MAG TPA: hypothetical protein ENN21_08400 [Spirochaetes bacterium]|nr:hypothetical protein [Spirochaetota bacterium]